MAEINLLEEYYLFSRITYILKIPRIGLNEVLLSVVDSIVLYAQLFASLQIKVAIIKMYRP
jgi:hypothetical protein